MLTSTSNPLPRWMRELDRLAAFKSQIYLYGQVKDTVLFPLAPSALTTTVGGEAETPWKLGSLREALFEYFRARGYAIIGAYNLVDGLVFADAPAAGLPQPLLHAPAKAEPKSDDEDEALTMAQLYEQLVEAGEKVAKADARGGRHPRAINPESPPDIALHQMRICLLNARLPSVFIIENAGQLIATQTNMGTADRLPLLRMLQASGESRTLSARAPGQRRGAARNAKFDGRAMRQTHRFAGVGLSE